MDERFRPNDPDAFDLLPAELGRERLRVQLLAGGVLRQLVPAQAAAGSEDAQRMNSPTCLLSV